MNEKVNNFLLAGDNFMPEMHLRQSGIRHSASRCSIWKKQTKNTKI